MDKCQRCESERLLTFSAKCSDLFSMSVGDGESESGYVPDCFLGEWGDYVKGTVCLDCGQWQGKFPVPTPEMG